MRTMNHITLIGRLGKDPELRTAAHAGTPWTVLSVATNRVRREGDAWIEEADWHQVKVFGREAEYAARNLKKGSLVGIEGALQYERWTSSDGQKHHSARIVADRLSLLANGRDASEVQAAQNAAEAVAAA